MSYLKKLTINDASTEAKEVLEAIKKKVGKIPNIYATIAQSPQTLKSFLDYAESLKSAELTPLEVEAVALAIAEENGCAYCLAAHTFIGKSVGLTEEQTIAIRSGTIEEAKLKALIGLAREITTTHGRPSQEALEAFTAQGYGQGALVTLIGLVSLNVFTNYLNHIAETEIDFPKAPSL